MSAALRPPLAVALVGCGPGGTSLLERLCANAPELLGDRGLLVHVIDPHPPGPGRVWREDQSPLLWANSLAADITVFTDERCSFDGPIRPGPSLWEWGRDRAAELRTGRLAPELMRYADELARLTPTWFAGRGLLGAYFSWAFREIVGSAPPGVRVLVHRDRAVDVADVADGSGRQRVLLGGGAHLVVDAVVLTQGHGDAEPTAEERRLAGYADGAGLTYIPCAYTAEQDLDALRPGEPVLVRGLGLAFVDLMVRLTTERGGRFERGADGEPTYRASGQEPLLIAASRRGVPYRTKIGYEWQGEAPALPNHLGLDAFADRPGRQVLDWRQDVRPLLEREMLWAYYERLFDAHPERTAMKWAEFAPAYAALLDAVAGRGPVGRAARAVEAGQGGRARPAVRESEQGGRGRPAVREAEAEQYGRPRLTAREAEAEQYGRACPTAREAEAELAALVARAVPDPADRCDLRLLDRPLAGRRFDDAEALQAAVHEHLAGDLARRTDARYSADLAATRALGSGFAVLTRLLAEDRVTERSRRDDLPGFQGFYNYLSSGPPGPRVAELLALARAGIVRFVGEDAAVAARDGAFVASSPSVPGVVWRARALVEARLPVPAPDRTRDPLLRALVARGDAIGETVAGHPSGLLRTAPTDQRLVAADGSPHPARFAHGYGVAGGAPLSSFARPHVDAPILRVHDTLARQVLTTLATLATTADPDAEPTPAGFVA